MTPGRAHIQTTQRFRTHARTTMIMPLRVAPSACACVLSMTREMLASKGAITCRAMSSMSSQVWDAKYVCITAKKRRETLRCNRASAVNQHMRLLTVQMSSGAVDVKQYHVVFPEGRHVQLGSLEHVNHGGGHCLGQCHDHRMRPAGEETVEGGGARRSVLGLTANAAIVHHDGVLQRGNDRYTLLQTIKLLPTCTSNGHDYQVRHRTMTWGVYCSVQGASIVILTKKDDGALAESIVLFPTNMMSCKTRALAIERTQRVP
jgi:hypothetical protein